MKDSNVELINTLLFIDHHEPSEAFCMGLRRNVQNMEVREKHILY